LEKLSRVKNCLAMYKIIAWRTMYLTYLNRKNERPPSPQTVWQGMKRMTDFATAWIVSQKQT